MSRDPRVEPRAGDVFAFEHNTYVARGWDSAGLLFWVAKIPKDINRDVREIAHNIHRFQSHFANATIIHAEGE